MLREGLTWRIRNFSFSPTKLAKEPIKKKVITRRRDAKKSGFFENFLKPVQELFQSLSGSNTDRVKKAVKSNLESALKGEKRTFQLNSGSTISGFVIQEDEVYYTVRESSGAETIVFKEDLKF